MSDNMRDKGPAVPPDRKPSSRDLQRAEALRANLMRRKAQTRDRAVPAPRDDNKSEGDA